jgi:hypothetical protein
MMYVSIQLVIYIDWKEVAEKMGVEREIGAALLQLRVKSFKFQDISKPSSSKKNYMKEKSQKHIHFSVLGFCKLVLSHSGTKYLNNN